MDTVYSRWGSPQSVTQFGMSVKGAETREGGLETSIRWLEVHKKSFRIPAGVFSIVKQYIEQTGQPDEITPREVGILHAATNTAAQRSGLTTRTAVEVCMNYLGYQRKDIDISASQMLSHREYSFVKLK